MDKHSMIGKTVYSYRSVYRPAPLVEAVIDSETSRSWVANTGQYNEHKFPKKGLPDGHFWSREELEEYKRKCVWVRANAWKISQRISDKLGYDTLMQIASLIGYSAE